jgi:integrase
VNVFNGPAEPRSAGIRGDGPLPRKRRRAAGEGAVFQTRNGQWRARLFVGIVDGKRKVREARFATQREAVAALRQWLRDRDAGLAVSSGRLTVGGFLDQWLASVRPSLRPSTYAAYELNVRRVRPHLGHLPLAKLTPADLQRCYAVLLERGIKGRPLSRRSVEQTHAVVHAAFEQAVRWGMLGRNPAQYATAPRPERREMRTLSQEQVERLIAGTRTDRLHALWVVLVTTGLRVGEALGLRWEDVDLRAGTLRVRRALQRQAGALVFVEPKTQRSRRTVYLVDGAVAALQAHRDQQQFERQQAGAAWEDHGLVFCTLAGRPLPPDAITYALRTQLARLGLPRVRVHDLRHTAASLLLQWGTHPKVVQEMLGHSTIAITLDLYSHTVPAMHQQAARQFGQLFRASAGAAKGEASNATAEGE